jgi:hypothetical protein
VSSPFDEAVRPCRSRSGSASPDFVAAVESKARAVEEAAGVPVLLGGGGAGREAAGEEEDAAPRSLPVDGTSVSFLACFSGRLDPLAGTSLRAHFVDAAEEIAGVDVLPAVASARFAFTFFVRGGDDSSLADLISMASLANFLTFFAFLSFLSLDSCLAFWSPCPPCPAEPCP